MIMAFRWWLVAAAVVVVLPGWIVIFGIMPLGAGSGAISGAPAFLAAVQVSVALSYAVWGAQSLDTTTSVYYRMSAILIAAGISLALTFLPFAAMDISLASIDPLHEGLPRLGAVFVAPLSAAGLLLCVVGVVLVLGQRATRLTWRSGRVKRNAR
jgi:hypothetical protein